MSATYAVRFIEAPPNARRSSSPRSLRWNVTPMCSRCMTSPGASEHMISIASWSPRKSEPLTVSYACERQSSSTLIAALIPPAAATECERTGWTLLMIPTLAPFWAAASAARWPARPAPMIKTSCAGMAPCARRKSVNKRLFPSHDARPRELIGEQVRRPDQDHPGRRHHYKHDGHEHHGSRPPDKQSKSPDHAEQTPPDRKERAPPATVWMQRRRLAQLGEVP